MHFRPEIVHEDSSSGVLTPPPPTPLPPMPPAVYFSHLDLLVHYRPKIVKEDSVVRGFVQALNHGHLYLRGCQDLNSGMKASLTTELAFSAVLQ